MAKQYDSGVHNIAVAKIQEAVTFNGTFNSAPDVFVTSYSTGNPAKGTGATSITTTGFDIYSEDTGDTGWIARESGFDDPFMEFSSQSDVSTDASSTINTPRDFSSTADTVHAVVSDSKIFIEEHPWFSQYYKYRNRIDISAIGSSSLTDFPVLINYTDPNLRDTTNGGDVEFSNGQDILFTDVSGTALLDFQIERYDETTGEVIAWVKSDVDLSADTYIYIYYGNANSIDHSDYENVWDSDYNTVWHLNELSVGTANEFLDSTGNLNYGTADNGLPTRIDGQIGYGQDLETDERVNHWNGFNPILTSNSATISIWCKLPSVGTTNEYIAGLDQNFYVMHTGNGDIRFRINTTEGGDRDCTASGLLDTDWHHIVGTWDGTNQILYVDGVSVDSRSLAETLDTSPTNLYAGLTTNGLAGYVDELRLSEIARDADWIAAQFDNQNDPSSFFSVAEQEINPEWFDINWTYRKEIVIDHSKVAGTENHTDFPMLVSFTDIAFRDTANGGHVGKSNGGDILFTLADGQTQLKHQIENYDETTGELVAWVKIPDLNYHINTEIFIYYGNAAAADQEDSTNVWDANFRAVYHLDESGDGTADEYKDSTTNGYDGQGGAGTPANTPTMSTNGQIVNSQDFDGTDYIALPTAIGEENPSNITLSAWVNHDVLDANPHRYLTIGTACNLKYGISSQEVSFTVTLDSGNNLLEALNVITATDTWYHVAGTWDGTTQSLYVNGELVASDTPSGTLTTTNERSMISNLGAPMSGLIDEAHLSDSARSGDWIETEYNNQNSPSTFYSIGAEEELYLFASTANVVIDTSSDINTEREFASAANVIVVTSSDIINQNVFTSTADIVFDASSDIHTTINFSSQADITFETASNISIYAIRKFSAEADVVFDASSDIFRIRDFTSQADITFDATSDIHTTINFSSQADIVFDATSDIFRIRDFTSQADITFDATSDIFTEMEFATQADIVFDATSDGNSEREFATQADIVFDATSDIFRIRDFTSQADITFDATSDIFRIREFISQADITSISSDPTIFTEREFTSQADVIFETASNISIYAIRKFSAEADVVFDASSDGNVEREFTSQADVIFETASNISIYAIRKFSAEADVVYTISNPTIDISLGFSIFIYTSFDVASDGNADRSFSSQADVVFDTSSAIYRETFVFESQADIVFDATSDIEITRSFSTQVDIVFDTNSSVNSQAEFKSTSPISWDINNPEIINPRYLESQADIVVDTRSDISNVGKTFECTAAFSFSNRSIIRQDININVDTADILWNATSDITGAWDFSIEADIVSDITTTINGYREFTSSPDLIEWDINDPGIITDNYFTSQADIGIETASNISIYAIREFSVEADLLAFITASDIVVDRSFTPTAEIISFITESSIQRDHTFYSVASIGWDIPIISGTNEREFGTQADVVWDMTSDTLTDREFKSTADIALDLSTDIFIERSLASIAEVTTDISSDVNVEIQFTPDTVDINFEIESTASNDIQFNSTADLVVDVPSVNMFKSNLFKSYPNIEYDIESDIFNDRNFNIDPEISTEIEENSIFTERNLSSTVNIIINIESKNIWNMSIQDLMTRTSFRSVTPKRTATIVVN